MLQVGRNNTKKKKKCFSVGHIEEYFSLRIDKKKNHFGTLKYFQFQFQLCKKKSLFHSLKSQGLAFLMQHDKSSRIVLGL